MKNNPDFASLHAYLCADGYVIRNLPNRSTYYRIGLKNTNKVLLIDFQNKFKKIFKIKPRLSKDKDLCIVNSKEIYYKIINKFGSFRSREWNILENMNKKCASKWLRSFFDCEAWVWARKGKNRAIGLESVNYNGLIQISDLLNHHFKIKSSVKKRKNRDIYVLCIYGKDQLIKFEKEIGFLHPFKKERLREAIESYVNYNWDFSINIRKIIKEKARAKPPYTIRIFSIIKNNLEIIQQELDRLNISSSIIKCKNGQGRKYYILSVYGKSNINKFIELKLLSKEQIKKFDVINYEHNKCKKFQNKKNI